MPENSAAGGESSKGSSKELLEKFGLGEVLGAICPGTLALSSILVWNPGGLAWFRTAVADWLSAALVLVSAYAVGLVLSLSSLHGAEAYRVNFAPPRPAGWREWPGFLQQWVYRLWLRVTVGVPDTGEEMALTATTNAYLDIQQVLERVFGLETMALLQRATEQLAMLRALATDQFKEQIAGLITEVEWLRRRLMFSLGVALASLILAASAALRLVVWKWYPHNVEPALLVPAMVIGTYASFKLRRVAADCWERELVLTLAIVRRFRYKL